MRLSLWPLSAALVATLLLIAGALPPAGAQTNQTVTPADAASSQLASPPAPPTPLVTDPVKTGGSPVSRNVYSAGGTVRLAGPVDGDFVAAGGRVMADHAVQGDALLVGGSVDVRGPVGDDLRAVGGDVSIESTVGGELYAAGGNLDLTKASRIGRGASVAAGRVSIDGQIIGPLRASGQRIVINGEVTGDVRLFGETIELGPTARITGTLHHTSREFKRAEGALVGGTVTREEMKRERRNRDDDWHRDREGRFGGAPWIGAVTGFLGLLAAGGLFMVLFPKFAIDVPERLRMAPWLSMAVGFGTLVGVPVLAVLLFISLLGIPLGVAALSVYPLLLLMGYLAGVLFIAQRIRQGFGRSGTATLRDTIGYLAAALLILLLIAWLPWIGALSVFITLIAGIGACVLEWHRRRQPVQTPEPK